MKNILKTTILAIALTAFVSCSDPLDKLYNEETIMEDLQSIVDRDKVSKQDLENLAYYVMAANFNEISLEGKTYRQLIEEANNFTEK